MISKIFNTLQQSIVKSIKYNISRTNIIDTAGAKALNQQQTVYIDCRGEDSYKACHIKGSKNIPQLFTYLYESKDNGLNKLADTFTDILQSKGISGNENLVFYEDKLDSMRGVSCRSLYLLSLFGYDENKLFVLKDGLDAWKKQQGVETGSEVSDNKKGSFTVKLNTKTYIDYNELFDSIKNKKSMTLIDVRDPEEWKGQSSSPYGPNFTPRKGRIPTSKHLLWTDLMTSQGDDFKSDKDIEKLVEQLGVKDKSQEIVVYCFKGCRSANAFVALKKAGYGNLKSYLGSWNEWSRDMDLPIDDKKY